MADAVIAVGWATALFGTGVWVAYLAGKFLIGDNMPAGREVSEHFPRRLHQVEHGHT